MRLKTDKIVNKKKKTSTKRVFANNAIDKKSRCNHCGGLLRHLPDDVSCINCGRQADHQCELCLYGRKDVVA